MDQKHPQLCLIEDGADQIINIRLCPVDGTAVSQFPYSPHGQNDRRVCTLYHLSCNSISSKLRPVVEGVIRLRLAKRNEIEQGAKLASRMGTRPTGGKLFHGLGQRRDDISIGCADCDISVPSNTAA